MESKKTYAHTAARCSLVLTFIAFALYCAPHVARALQLSMPPLNAMAVFTLISATLVFCLIASLVCGFIALSGVKRHGREGILVTATISLVLSALMLMPILYGVAYGAGFAVSKVLAREKKAGPAPAPTPSETRPSPRLATTSAKQASMSQFIPAEKRTDLIHDPVRNILYVSAGTEVLRFSFPSNQFLSAFVLGGDLCGIDLSPDGHTLAVADRTRDGGQVWVHRINLATGTSSRSLLPAARNEAGSYSVAFGADGALYTTSSFQGSGRVPFRRIDLETGNVHVIAELNQDTMLCASADRRQIAFAESNSSRGRFGIYDIEQKKFTRESFTGQFNWEVAISRDGALVAVPGHGRMTIAGASPQTIGNSDGWPSAAAFHPTRDIVFFPVTGSKQIHAYDTRGWKLMEQIDFNEPFEHTGNRAFRNGRLRTSQDGTWLFVTVKGGVCYVRPKLNNEFATVDRR